MLTKVLSATVLGIQGIPVTVEVDYARKSFPHFRIVGLPHKSIAEARERVRSALINAQFKIPSARITINLAPADFPKKGTLFDMPIAVGLLVSAGVISPSAIENVLFIGELSLDGSVTPIPGVVPICLYAKRAGIQTVFIPYGNRDDVVTIRDCTIVVVRTLSEIVAHLRTPQALSDRHTTSWSEKIDDATRLAIPIKGQLEARRALEIALAGGHHLYMKGPPGVGKTLLAHCAPYLMPSLSEEEYYDVLSIQSLYPKDHQTDRVSRPFRAPHSSISARLMIGGGQFLAPGEVTRAHNGILYLDEFPLFSSSVIDSLRKPLEDGYIDVPYLRGSMRLPARFLLVATGNICPCGYLGHPIIQCTCSQQSISSYSRKVSGPVMDRIDLHIHMHDVTDEEIAEKVTYDIGPVRSRISQAYDRQRQRYEKNDIQTNAHIPHHEIEMFCPLEDDAKKLLVAGYKRLHFSARSYFKSIKIARTIADLEGSDTISESHIAEAMYYRE